jgi:protein-S-isoprenylcysteine O-methyltransferase Ste14
MSGGNAFLMRWRVRAGYPMTIVFFLLARPNAFAVACGAVVAAAGLLLRGTAAGHLYKHHDLAISGPYAHTRNPLYLGSALLAAGLLVAGRSWMAAILVTAYFLAFYPGVMKREERELLAHYGRPFEEYAAAVPLFWPALRSATAARATTHFSWAQYRRNREYQVLLGFLGVLALLWVRWWVRMRFGY